MTVILVSGIVAAIYLLWLIFTLLPLALPTAVGISIGLLLDALGFPLPISLLGAMAGAVATLGGARHLFIHLHSSLARHAVAAGFVLPAAVAGFCAVRDIGHLALDDGWPLTALAFLGAGVITGSTWRHATLLAAG